MKAYVLGEGHGEVIALQNLLVRLTKELKLDLRWAKPLRWLNLHQKKTRSGKGGVVKGANYIRSKSDASALLVLRDEDDGCPKDVAPVGATWLRELDLPFPSAYVLFHPEYEVIFLPCLGGMVGKPLGRRPGLLKSAQWDGDWERKRGIKEWLSQNYPSGRSYKPTLDQLLLTQMVEIPTLLKAGIPCVGSLERAIRFLVSHQGDSGAVYPAAR